MDRSVWSRIAGEVEAGGVALVCARCTDRDDERLALLVHGERRLAEGARLSVDAPPPADGDPPRPDVDGWRAAVLVELTRCAAADLDRVHAAVTALTSLASPASCVRVAVAAVDGALALASRVGRLDAPRARAVLRAAADRGRAWGRAHPDDAPHLLCRVAAAELALHEIAPSDHAADALARAVDAVDGLPACLEQARVYARADRKRDAFRTLDTLAEHDLLTAADLADRDLASLCTDPGCEAAVRRALPAWEALAPVAFQESWGFSPLVCAGPDALRAADLTRPARVFLGQAGLPAECAARLAFALDGPLPELGAVQPSTGRPHAGCPVIGRTFGGDRAVYVDGGGAVWAQSESAGRDVMINTSVAKLATSLLYFEVSTVRPAIGASMIAEGPGCVPVSSAQLAADLADQLFRLDPDAVREGWWREVLFDAIVHGGLDVDLDARFAS